MSKKLPLHMPFSSTTSTAVKGWHNSNIHGISTSLPSILRVLFHLVSLRFLWRCYPWRCMAHTFCESWHCMADAVFRLRFSATLWYGRFL